MTVHCARCFTRQGVHPHEVEHMETIGDFTKVWYEKVSYCNRCEVEFRAAGVYERMGITDAAL
jgi:hypothetical protein